MSDTLKKHLSIQTDNAQLLSIEQDTLVRIKYLAGYKYESLYLKKEESAAGKKTKECELKTLINGTSSYPVNKVRIQFVDKRENKVVLENSFFYK